MREPKEYTKEYMKKLLEDTVRYFREHPKHPIPDEELDRMLIEDSTDERLEFYVRFFTAMREERRAMREQEKEEAAKKAQSSNK